jgi:hypothetical protein
MNGYSDNDGSRSTWDQVLLHTQWKLYLAHLTLLLKHVQMCIIFFLYKSTST